MAALSPARIGAILVKEFIQMRRDRMTFAMMVGIPILQLILFGYAINTDPKDLPTAVVTAEHGRFARSITAALANSGYFDLVSMATGEAEARRLLAEGEVAFVVYIPPGFERDLLRGERPQLLVEADATDPAAASNALGAAPEIIRAALRDDLKGPASRYGFCHP
jgi:ABC-2 type transport system permease protein